MSLVVLFELGIFKTSILVLASDNVYHSMKIIFMIRGGEGGGGGNVK